VFAVNSDSMILSYPMTGATMSRTSVLLADDHVMLLDVLVRLLREDFNVVGTARDGRSLIEMARQKRPEVIVMDIQMPLNGIDATRILQKEGCSAKILFLTMHSDLSLVEEAFRAGASGFLLKVSAPEEFVKAIQAVAKGAKYITSLLAGDLVSSLIRAASRAMPFSVRQREVMQLLAEGKTMKEMATLMGISTGTAKGHKCEVMRLLGVQSTAALIRYAIRFKLV
jgi:DNA-binding NarL/FixJ family response regulator